MKQIIAIPTNNGILCPHFGHCEKFAVFNTEDSVVKEIMYLNPPPHEPGVLPAWLASHGITHVIAGGMGHRAISLFNQQNITVITGAETKAAKTVVDEYLGNNLITGDNACNH
jgi:predicted Fe-Mo cluster-binding NifX family protein